MPWKPDSSEKTWQNRRNNDTYVIKCLYQKFDYFFIWPKWGLHGWLLIISHFYMLLCTQAASIYTWSTVITMSQSIIIMFSWSINIECCSICPGPLPFALLVGMLSKVYWISITVVAGVAAFSRDAPCHQNVSQAEGGYYWNKVDIHITELVLLSPYICCSKICLER